MAVSSLDAYRVFQEVHGALQSACALSVTDSALLEYLMGKSGDGLAHYASSIARYKLREKLWQLRHPLRALSGAPIIQEAHLKELGVLHSGFTPLIDLAAIPLASLRRGELDFAFFAQYGIKHVVLMEDRNPLFFLNYKKYKKLLVIPLAKQFCASDRDLIPWMADDLSACIELFHKAGIKVILGFWGHIDDNAHNPFVQANREALCPAIPGSDDLNPISIVKDGDMLMTFPDYVAKQYALLQKDFSFDGLFLGDGLMGYRNFLTPLEIGEYSFTRTAWEYCYSIIAETVHRTNGELWAFDVMGRTYEDAQKSGVDYAMVLPHLDRLIVQTYGGVAWRKFMHIPGYTVERDVIALQSIFNRIAEEDRQKVLCTLELSDGVEGWRVTKKDIEQQLAGLSTVSSGWLGVWSNAWIRYALSGNR